MTCRSLQGITSGVTPLAGMQFTAWLVVHQVNSAGGGPVSAEWMVPKALWIRQNEPHIFDAAAHICEAQVRREG